MIVLVNGFEFLRLWFIYFFFFVELYDYFFVLKIFDMIVGGFLFFYAVRSEKLLRFEGEFLYRLWNDG